MHLLALLGGCLAKNVCLATASLYVLTVALLLGVALYCSFVKRLRSARFFPRGSSAFLMDVPSELSFLGVIPGNFFSENTMQLGCTGNAAAGFRLGGSGQ